MCSKEMGNYGSSKAKTDHVSHVTFASFVNLGETLSTFPGRIPILSNTACTHAHMDV